jgi:hypothetical protein
MKLGVQLNVPDVFEAFAVNALPVVAGELATVRELIASPSGSVADTVKLRATPSFALCVAGAVTTGAREAASFTEITVRAVPESTFDAVNVTVYTPPWMGDGVQLNVPDVRLAFGVNVLPVVAGELAAVSELIVSPSGSVADTMNVRLLPSTTVCVAGAVTTGARSGSVETVITVEAVPLKALLAVNVTVYVPICVDDGVQLNVPDVRVAFGVNVAPVGSAATVKDVISSPSGSAAVTVNVISVFSCTDTFARAKTTGLRSTLFTVITVDAVPDSTGVVEVAVNVTV